MGRTRIGSGGAGFHYKPGNHLEEIDIPVTTLDEYFHKEAHESIHFIKCDVEGHEYEVLKGGEALLRRDAPVLLLECHHAEACEGKLFGYLEELGYQGFFYFVRPEDHRRYRYKDRGHYVRHTEFDQYEYNRPTAHHRNYIFTREANEISKLIEYRRE